MHHIKTILKWHKDACPEPDLCDRLTAEACLAEECAEYFKATNSPTIADTLETYATNMYKFASNIRGMGKDEKTHKNMTSYLDNIDKKAHCDALCDIIVVALQEGYRSGYDMEAALAEVAKSNESKRLPDGSFPRNEAGKFVKTSPNYFEADVTPFLGG